MNLRAPQPHEPDVWARAVKATVVVLCGVVPAIGIGMLTVRSLLDAFDPVGESIEHGLLALALFVGPTAIYARFIRRKVPILVFGTGLLALDACSAWVAFTDDSSTAALALLWIPFFGLPLVLVGCLVQAWSRPPDA